MEEISISNKEIAEFIPQRGLTTTLAHIDAGMEDTEATFDLYIRELPLNRSYLVFVGLEDVINYLLNLKFSDENITFLKTNFSLSEKAVDCFKNFKFTGNVYAIKEGTIFFPNEPVIRITAPLAQLQIIESVLFNLVGFQTLIASKISRVVHAAKPAKVKLGENRAHGLEAGIKAIRAGYIVGTSSTPLLLAFKKYKVPLSVGGVATHFFITSFPSEKEAFRVYLKSDPKGSMMIDTYSYEQGLKNIIEVAKELEKEGKKLRDISIDSGDLAALWSKVRKALDENGLNYVTLSAFSNLDEYKIFELKQKGANYDFFGVATEVVTSSDCPKIEIVYKLAEIKENGIWKPKAKFSPGKISYGGRKQIFRVKESEHFVKDVLGLEQEKIEGEKLLEPVIVCGKLLKDMPSIEEIRVYTALQYTKFQKELFSLDKTISYPVELSDGLQECMKKLREERGLK